MRDCVTGIMAPLQLGLPQSIPPQYNALKDCNPEDLNARLRVLHHFSDLMYKSWRLLNLNPMNQVTCYTVFWANFTKAITIAIIKQCAIKIFLSVKDFCLVSQNLIEY